MYTKRVAILFVILIWTSMIFVCTKAHAEGITVKPCNISMQQGDAANEIPFWLPCQPLVDHDEVRIGKLGVTLEHGQTIDFADWHGAVYRGAVGQPGYVPHFRGWVWIKVQGEYFLTPYYAVEN